MLQQAELIFGTSTTLKLAVMYSETCLKHAMTLGTFAKMKRFFFVFSTISMRMMIRARTSLAICSELTSIANWMILKSILSLTFAAGLSTMLILMANHSDNDMVIQVMAGPMATPESKVFHVVITIGIASEIRYQTYRNFKCSALRNKNKKLQTLSFKSRSE